LKTLGRSITLQSLPHCGQHQTAPSTLPCIAVLASLNYVYWRYRAEVMHWFCEPDQSANAPPASRAGFMAEQDESQMLSALVEDSVDGDQEPIEARGYSQNVTRTICK